MFVLPGRLVLRPALAAPLSRFVCDTERDASLSASMSTSGLSLNRKPFCVAADLTSRLGDLLFALGLGLGAAFAPALSAFFLSNILRPRPSCSSEREATPVVLLFPKNFLAAEIPRSPMYLTISVLAAIISFLFSNCPAYLEQQL